MPSDTIAMNGRRIWLVYNESSGSNDAVTLSALEAEFVQAGFEIARKACFPADPVPNRQALSDEDISLVAVFAGDGTVATTVTGLYGWDGQVLVLPGGTMNMLARRLHGDAEPAEIVRRLVDGVTRAERPAIIRSNHGDALTGVLAGPGAAWNDVREAMRNTDVLEMVSSATDAIGESMSGARVRCADVTCGQPEGYAAITLTPTERGLDGNGYLAESVGDMVGQAVALLQRDFRNGPHEHLGLRDNWQLVCADNEPMGLLLDGEPCEGGIVEDFCLARCDVDLVVTADA